MPTDDSPHPGVDASFKPIADRDLNAIAYRDLPSMRPNDTELRVVADRVIERLGGLSVHEARWLRIELMQALGEVRRIATDHAANKAREYYQMRKSW